MSSFFETVTAAINDFMVHGYDSQKRLDDWVKQIKAAAIRSLVPESTLDRELRRTLTTAYKRTIIKMQPTVGRFTVERLKPKARRELDRRIMVSANLIKLNRQQSIDKTLQRFSGWATSIPAGGSDTTNKKEQKELIRKSLASLPYEERRVIIDQSHKLGAAISEIIAVGGGAIAAVWKSHYKQPGYDYRQDHKERDDQVYLLENSWAREKGLVKAGDAGYLESITRPGEEVNCRCSYVYVFSIENLPENMLTDKGRAMIAQINERSKNHA